MRSEESLAILSMSFGKLTHLCRVGQLFYPKVSKSLVASVFEVLSLLTLFCSQVMLMVMC